MESPKPPPSHFPTFTSPDPPMSSILQSYSRTRTSRGGGGVRRVGGTHLLQRTWTCGRRRGSPRRDSGPFTRRGTGTSCSYWDPEEHNAAVVMEVFRGVGGEAGERLYALSADSATPASPGSRGRTCGSYPRAPPARASPRRTERAPPPPGPGAPPPPPTPNTNPPPSSSSPHPHPTQLPSPTTC